jgi:hypothetical protein
MARFIGAMLLIVEYLDGRKLTRRALSTAVYGATQAAIDAKTELHGRTLLGSEIRIYYGMVWI